MPPSIPIPTLCRALRTQSHVALQPGSSAASISGLSSLFNPAQLGRVSHPLHPHALTLLDLLTTPSTSYFPSRPGQAALQLRPASKKTGGGTRNTKDSAGKRLGVKKHGGAPVISGNIILRQRGLKVHPSYGVGVGRDHTLFATRAGTVKFFYDLPRRRAFVAVDDGSVPPVLLSKNEAKAKLVRTIDLDKYMTLRGEERHAYVLELVEKYEKDAEAARESVGEEWLLTRRRTFTGVDVTQLLPSS